MKPSEETTFQLLSDWNSEHMVIFSVDNSYLKKISKESIRESHMMSSFLLCFFIFITFLCTVAYTSYLTKWIMFRYTDSNLTLMEKCITVLCAVDVSKGLIANPVMLNILNCKKTKLTKLALTRKLKNTFLWGACLRCPYICHYTKIMQP